MPRALEPNRTARRETRRKGLHVGYLRVSAADQSELRQLDGEELGKTFTDKASGPSTQFMLQQPFM